MTQNRLLAMSIIALTMAVILTLIRGGILTGKDAN